METKRIFATDTPLSGVGHGTWASGGLMRGGSDDAAPLRPLGWTPLVAGA